MKWLLQVKTTQRIAFCFGLFVGFLLLPTSIWANSSGIFGYTGRNNSCTTCHVQEAGFEDRMPQITITPLDAPSQIVAGTTLGFEIRARRSINSNNRWAGFNAEVQYAPLGALSIAQVGSGIDVLDAEGVDIEVTHNSKKDFLQGAVQENGATVYEVAWTFFVRIPVHFPLEQNQELTVYTAVNNTNGAGNSDDYVNTSSFALSLPALSIQCGESGASDVSCQAQTFDPALHFFEQNIPCCCPDADEDGYMASFCNPLVLENGGDCQDEGDFADRVHPGADENAMAYRCDFLDNDCNGIVDDLVYPELGDACMNNADCPEGYYCNVARDYVASRCALPCAENNNGDDNSTHYCNAGFLRCLDTVDVEYCNGLDDDGDGLFDENYVNGTPPLGSECSLGGPLIGQVICDDTEIGMICGDPPMTDAGVVDAGAYLNMSDDAGAWRDGGTPRTSDDGGASSVWFFDSGMTTDPDGGMSMVLLDAGSSSNVWDASVMPTEMADAGHVGGISNDAGTEPIISKPPETTVPPSNCGCQTHPLKETGLSSLCVCLVLFCLRRKRRVTDVVSEA